MSRAALAVIIRVRSALPTEEDAMSELASEERSKSVERMHDGLFERFYKNRLAERSKDAGAESFRQLCREVLDGKAGLAEISAWRVENLGGKADMCRHYDAFILAEGSARHSRVKARASPGPGESAMQGFARLANKKLSLATEGGGWEGYSVSATEMSARGFEGNCFLGTPDQRRAYLVDGRDNSMYWPVGAERGAHADAYRAYIACAARAMVDAGDMPSSALDGFQASGAASGPGERGLAAPASRKLDIAAKLAAKRAARAPTGAWEPTRTAR